MNEIAANSMPSIEPSNEPENQEALLNSSKQFLVEKMTKLDLDHKFDESSLVKIQRFVTTKISYHINSN
jgi:hypothetical protein